MKTFYFTLFLVITSISILLTRTSLQSNESTNSQNVLSLTNKFTVFYNQLLDDQEAISKINLLRPKIYVYTDFGGGKNQQNPLIDAQTSGEISGGAWKSTLQQDIHINDSAKPLSPIDAAISLAKTFPYVKNGNLAINHEESAKEIYINLIVVHVIDPGVGNDGDEKNPQSRAIVLRKDGVLFIGPDNGTLSFACPQESLSQCWEIDNAALVQISQIDTKAGGTFHGRDIFCEAAFRIAAAMISPEEIGIKYENLDLKNRFHLEKKYGERINEIDKISFKKINTERYFYNASFTSQSELFGEAFLLGIVQSSLYQDGLVAALTASKRLFLPKEEAFDQTISLIGIINYKSGNIFVGPNNGLGTSFTKDFSDDDFKIFHISEGAFKSIVRENNNEIAATIIEGQPKFDLNPKTIDFFGNSRDLIKDELLRPKRLKAKIWIDLYGNIKTSMSSEILNEAKRLLANVEVVINGIKKPVIFAETFSQVPEEHLFIYNGSTGLAGPNPHRSKRYVELTSNGIFGKFGIDFFESNGRKPTSSDIIWIEFKYPND